MRAANGCNRRYAVNPNRDAGRCSWEIADIRNCLRYRRTGLAGVSDSIYCSGRPALIGRNTEAPLLTSSHNAKSGLGSCAHRQNRGQSAPPRHVRQSWRQLAEIPHAVTGFAAPVRRLNPTASAARIAASFRVSVIVPLFSGDPSSTMTPSGHRLREQWRTWNLCSKGGFGSTWIHSPCRRSMTGFCGIMAHSHQAYG